jgi:hypothetical protein
LIKDVVARAVALCDGSSGVIRAGRIMTAQRVEHVFALAIGFAIASCWSLMGGAIVVMGLRAFGISVG